jgi:hypothetical protein
MALTFGLPERFYAIDNHSQSRNREAPERSAKHVMEMADE